jgi:putative aldouronate transport system substrate-binding protein
MKKRILSLLLASSIIVTLAGCSSKETKTSEPSKAANTTENAINFNEAPYTINISYPVYGSTPADLQKVFDKANEITLKKINAKVELKTVPVTNMANAYSLAAASGEKSDLICLMPGSKYITQFIASKMIKPFDAELDKYGKDMKAGLGDYLEVGKYQGKQYTIPESKTNLSAGGVQLLKSYVDKYNIDMTKIKTYSDLDAVFEKVKAGEPDLQIFFPSGSSYYFLNFDTLGNSFGVLKNGGLNDLKVVNMFETDEYVSMVKKMREWYLKGYVPKDFATSQSQPTALQTAGKVFAVMNSIAADNNAIGEVPPKTLALFVDPVKKTDLLQTIMWAIPASAQRPDKTIQFLNLVYQDKELANLIRYGIQGEHYDVVKDGVIDTNKGTKTYKSGWNLFGDSNKYFVTSSSLVAYGGDLAKYNEKLSVWNKNTKTSKAFGFIFNPDPVKTEVAALTAVTEQYQKLLEGGAVDPEKELKAFNDKLYAAGLKKVIDEKQKQLDEWAKAKGVK